MVTRAEIVQVRKADARWRIKYRLIQAGYYISIAILATVSCIFIAVLLSGCGGKPERTIGLADPVSGCKWVATQYGDGFMGGNYVKPQTDSNGEQICEKGGV